MVEVAAHDDVSRTLGTPNAARVYAERAVSERLHHISIDQQRAMEEYVRQQLRVGALARLLSRSRMFTALTAATPPPPPDELHWESRKAREFRSAKSRPTHLHRRMP